MESMKYQNKIKKDDEEEETVITLSCFLGDIVNDLTSKALMVASLIEKDVVHLLKEFESAEAVRVQAILKQSE